MTSKSNVYLLFVAVTVNLTVITAGENASFPRSKAILIELVQENGDSGINHIYVSPIKTNGGDSFAWVFWKEKRQLILWEPFDSRKWRLSYSKRILDLDRDVVAAADLNGSTYLVDEEWACLTIDDCLKNGTEYIIQK